MNKQNEKSLETIKNSSVFSFFTIFSRFFGLLRDTFKAAAFGTSYLVTAFDVAFQLPNALRNLVAEGALSQAFIPLYEKYKSDKKGSLAERQAAGAVLVFMTIVLTFICIIAWFVLPILIPLIRHDPEKTQEVTRLTISLARLLFPYILIISLSSIFMAIQYSYNSFAAGSFGPALQNIVLVSSFAIYYYQVDSINEQAIYFWASFVLVAALAQLAFQILAVYRLGVLPKLQLPFKHPILKGLFYMMAPALFGTTVQEFGQLIDITLATSIENKVAAAIPALRYAHLVIHLPMGVFGVAVATASLPQLSKLFKEKNVIEFQNRLRGSILLNAFLLLPSTIGLFIFNHQIIEVIFQRGSFDAQSTAATATALKYYSLGIFAYSLQKLFLSAFYAQKNSKLPAIITFCTLIANVVLSLLLMPTLYHGGLALGSSLAAFLGSFVYISLLVRKKSLILDKQLLYSFLRIIILNGLLLSFLVGFQTFTSKFSSTLQLALAIPLATVFYIVIAKFLQIDEYRQFNVLFLSIINRLRKR